MRREDAPDHAELGYWIARPFRGRGHATAAARRLVTHGFERLRLTRIAARCPRANRAAIRVVEKLGLRFAGVEPDASTASDDAMCRYELGREEWPAGRER